MSLMKCDLTLIRFCLDLKDKYVQILHIAIKHVFLMTFKY